MILGMTAFTATHVLISLIGIVSGLVVLFGMRASQLLNGWTLIFLVTTLATNITGFMFPYHGFTPAIGVGILSSLILVVALVARYSAHLAHAWRWVYVVASVAALYFNCFVLVAQAFQKIPALHALAPSGAGPVFGAVQGIVLLLFVLAGVLCVKGFHPKVAV